MCGYITRCNSKTEPEVLSKHLMGDLPEYIDMFRGVNEDDLLFLYNFETFQFFGPYKPVGKGGTIDGKAWGGKFPAQIKFEELPETKQVPFNKVAHIITRWYKDIYPWPELSEEQTLKILDVMSKY